MGRNGNRRRARVRITTPAEQSPDDVRQHMARWRKELAFSVAQHPHLVAKAKEIGIVLDLDEPKPGNLM
jgi:hypothetical protein